METIKLQTQSVLYENEEEQFQVFLFNELLNEQFVVYQNMQPKYFLDLNQKTKPLIQDLIAGINSGKDLESSIKRLGVFLGRGKWTTKPKIDGIEINGIRKIEIIELELLNDLADVCIDLNFLATNEINYEILLNQDKLFEAYLIQDSSGFWGIEGSTIDGSENLKNLLSFLFETEINVIPIASGIDKEIFDLTIYKNLCITPEKFELRYEEWLLISGRNNSMSEYGAIICIIGYIHRNLNKKNLVLVIEKRKHFVF